MQRRVSHLAGNRQLRATRTSGYWIIMATLVAGCVAPDTAVAARDCTVILDSGASTHHMPLEMPEDLLDLGNGDGVYCHDGNERALIRWIYSPVTSGDEKTFWIVANPSLVDSRDVEPFFSGLAGTRLSVELIDTTESVDYYLASTDLDTARAAVESSSRRLSVADYRALGASR